MGKDLRTGMFTGASCLVLLVSGTALAQINQEEGTSQLSAQPDHALLRAYTADELDRLGFVSVVAGGPGDTIYSNTIDPITSVYTPGANQMMADDLHLASDGCSLTHYEIGIVGLCAFPNFDVEVALWDGDPCDPNSSIIEGTQQLFEDVPCDSIPKIGEVTLDTPIPIPQDVWMAATFSRANTGWLIATQAEVGTTQNLFSEDDTGGGCGLYVLTSGSHAGFWAEINCNLVNPPVGACCNLSQCTQTTQAACTTGVWQGPFTTCVPNSCLTGTCCSGVAFDDCQSTSEADCVDGIFAAGDTCEVEGCGSTFKVYENDFFTGIFSGVVPENSRYGDDLTFAPGAPCDLIAFDVTVFGDPTAGPASFNATVELWTNDDNGTPDTPEDDLPLAPIAGTSRAYTNIPADFFGHRLLAGAFEGIVLPQKAWVVVDTSSENAGPGLGGEADIGSSLDLFAIFNHPDEPNAWLGGFFFGGFDPNNPCPGGTEAPCPAGSFRTNVWCAGDAPSGACCDQFNGTCSNDVTQPDCAGRWVEGASCDDPDVFIPACGTHACCHKFELNPTITICQDLVEEECDVQLDGFLARGRSCSDLDDTCPLADCLGNAGDCLIPHAEPGCNDPFCTCDVCEEDDFCCIVEWDASCVLKAEELCPQLFDNDACANARNISGEGTFDFDNTDATRDGPSHESCPSPTGNEIIRDTWFRWESPCTDLVVVQTCDQTAVDTKVAVYQDAQCPVDDADLLACNDNRCVLQSLTTIDAVAGEEYLIRVGSAPNQAGGPGTFTITCGSPDNPACPGGSSDCCTPTVGTLACTNETCCGLVCALRSLLLRYRMGRGLFHDRIRRQRLRCRAGLRLAVRRLPGRRGVLHGPPDGAVDARQPFNPLTGSPLLGIDTVVVAAPPGADLSCFSFCETSAEGAPNEIVDINEVAGVYTIVLDRPITPGAVSTVTYANALGTMVTGEFVSHPGNANADDTADAEDLGDLVAALDDPGSLPFGDLSLDADHSGMFTPLDLLANANLLNGSNLHDVWNNTPQPSAGSCP